MPGTFSGARKRLTWSDMAAVAPVFGFGNDVDAFAVFICEQQGKADQRITADEIYTKVDEMKSAWYGHVCEREDLGEYGR